MILSPSGRSLVYSDVNKRYCRRHVTDGSVYSIGKAPPEVRLFEPESRRNVIHSIAETKNGIGLVTYSEWYTRFAPKTAMYTNRGRRLLHRSLEVGFGWKFVAIAHTSSLLFVVTEPRRRIIRVYDFSDPMHMFLQSTLDYNLTADIEVLCVSATGDRVLIVHSPRPDYLPRVVVNGVDVPTCLNWYNLCLSPNGRFIGGTFYNMSDFSSLNKPQIGIVDAVTHARIDYFHNNTVDFMKLAMSDDRIYAHGRSGSRLDDPFILSVFRFAAA